MASSIGSNCNHCQKITHFIKNTIKTLKTFPASLNFPHKHQQLEYIDSIFPENITVTNPILSRFYKPITLKRIGCLLSLTLRSMAAYRLLTFSLVICILYPCNVLGVDPKFDPSTRMRLVLVPADAQVGSIIYRLRATDEEFDYPLTFEFVGDASSSTVKIDSLPCTKYNSVCQANVVLQRRLESGRYYDFQVSVKDTKGGIAMQMCSITATNYTTPHDIIFPHKPGIIMVYEDAKRGTELDYVIARKNPLFQKPVYLELWGSPLFAIRQKIVSPETTEGTIFLLGPLDFEKQAMYHLTVLANDAYAEPGQDNRNIAGMEIVVIVQDVQDQPPVFTLAPPVTKLPAGILPGDKILEVHAEDGDKGSPRKVRYGLVSEGNPFTSFFDINDTSGEIFLMRPLDDITAITHVGDPVLLTVIAEEVKIGPEEPPAMAATVQLALFLPDRTNSAPYFENDHYVTRLDENAPQGTALTFTDPYVPRVYDDDTGKNGVFSLTLVDNNGTFEISPNVAERNTMFLIRVRDNTLLDYEERREVQFQIFAQELGPATNLSATVNVTVFLNDVNDNPPVFEQPVYTVDLPENMTVGTKVLQVLATDMDSDSGSVRYTAILGYLNTSLNLDAVTGVITVSKKNHGFDREIMPEYHLYVEARDNDGIGNHAQVPLIIKLIDINDETPLFEKELYEFILAPNLLGFTTNAVIYALDKDATKPNNEVRYEIIFGNYEKRFALDKVTGELTVTKKIDLQSDSKKYLRTRRQTLTFDDTNSGMANDNDFFKLTARAYDMGVPVLYSTTIIRVYPPESRKRTVTFVVPGHNPDKSKTEETLSTITGGRVIIHEIRPLHLEEPGVQNLPKGNQEMNDRSVVTATVLYDSSSVVDISQIQQRLSQHNSSFAIMTRDTNETDTLYKAENKLLFWLLILLATLVAVTILTLLLCCICSWCPLYGSATKRIVNISKTDDDVHLMHRDGKQTKSVQVAEWMERREAWSAEKPSNSRTKSTRWEFHNGCPQFNEDLREPAEVEQNDKDDRSRFRSSEEQQKRVKIRNSNSVKNATSFHNSRTNLINDPEVFIEDMIDDQEEIDNRKHFQRSKANKQIAYKQRKFYDPGTSQKDDDSIRRHEIDRGSDIDFNTALSSLKNTREFFMKDGNVEILQLIPRDKKLDENNFDDDNIYANFPTKTSTNLSHPQLLMIDNTGKEILMRRFIEEQPDGKQIIREHYQIVSAAAHLQNMPNQIQPTATMKGETFPIVKSGPNSIVYSQTEPEVKVIHTQPDQSAADGFPVQLLHATSNQSLTQELENSLKQQNALLRHILLEKEKLEVRCAQHEITLETQSLPGQSVTMATQTGCEACTQTENFIRRSRSENDDSMSEEEYEYVRLNPPNSPEEIYWLERKRQKRRLKNRRSLANKRIIMVETVKRKIRTPIKEEDEFNENRKRSPPKKPFRETKMSLLRKQKMKEIHEAKSNLDSLNRDVLIEISDSLEEAASPSKDQKRKKNIQQVEYVDTSNCEEDKEYSDHYVDSDTDEIVITTNTSTVTASQQDARKEGMNNTKGKLDFRTTDLPRNRKLNHNESQSSTERNGTSKLKYYRQNGSQSSSSLQASIRKHGVSEHRLSKQSIAKVPSSLKENPKIVTNDDTKYKPEPAPRKSPPKDSRLLKEDIAMNKQHKLRLVKDKNHPLLQHSEHRFERENAPEVPAPPTKLPHYMYPETPPGINTVIQNQGSQQAQPQPSPIKENEVKVTSSKINLYVENHKTSQPPQITSHNSQKLLNAATLEDDHDSGIAMNSLLNSIGRRNPISEKKSVFSIAYDDVSRVKKIQSGGESPQNS